MDTLRDVDIDPRLLALAMAASGKNTVKEAVEDALRLLIQKMQTEHREQQLPSPKARSSLDDLTYTHNIKIEDPDRERRIARKREAIAALAGIGWDGNLDEMREGRSF